MIIHRYFRFPLLLFILVSLTFFSLSCSLGQPASAPAPEEQTAVEDPTAHEFPVSENLDPSASEEPLPIVRASYEEILIATEGLSTESVGFGPGNTTDEKNRPLSAQSYEINYGEYGLEALTDDAGLIYLTFDQGYENGYTSAILDTLKKKSATATFFVTMDYAKRNSDLVQRMLNEGHLIGNHSTSHRSTPTLSVQECVDEIMNLHTYILDTYGYEMNLYRPPSGEFSVMTLEIANLLGYKNVFWSFAYVDWKTDDQPDATEAYDRITSKTHEGAIYLLHSVSETNTLILGDVIDYWQNNGYEVRAFQ